MLPVAHRCNSALPSFHAGQADPEIHADHADGPDGPVPDDLQRLPLELLAHIASFLPAHARGALALTSRDFLERMPWEVVNARLEAQLPRICTVSTMRRAINDALCTTFTDDQRSQWLGRLAGRLSQFPTQAERSAARELLESIKLLPLTCRAQPLLALIEALPHSERFRPDDAVRVELVSQIRALPLALQSGLWSGLLNLVPLTELYGTATRAWMQEFEPLPPSGRGVLLAELADIAAPMTRYSKVDLHAEMFAALLALPPSERVTGLCVLARHDRGQYWNDLFDAAMYLSRADGSALFGALAANLRHAADMPVERWERLWDHGTPLQLSPEQRARWLADMASVALTGVGWQGRWNRLWEAGATLPPGPRGEVAEALAGGLADVLDDEGRAQRWQALLELADGLPSSGRARLLKQLAAVLLKRPTVEDDARWEALVAAAQTLEPLERALVLIACMVDGPSVDRRWTAFRSALDVLSHEQAAIALEALAPKLEAVAPESRPQACLHMLEAVGRLPVPLQRGPGLVLAPFVAEIGADSEQASLVIATTDLLKRWAADDRVKWLDAAISEIDDLDQAYWLMDRLRLVPPPMRAWPVAQLADWAAYQAELDDRSAFGLFGDLCEAGRKIPAQHRGAVLPAMTALLDSISSLRLEGAPMLEALKDGVPDCDLPRAAASGAQETDTDTDTDTDESD